MWRGTRVVGELVMVAIEDRPSGGAWEPPGCPAHVEVAVRETGPTVLRLWCDSELEAAQLAEHLAEQLATEGSVGEFCERWGVAWDGPGSPPPATVAKPGWPPWP